MKSKWLFILTILFWGMSISMSDSGVIVNETEQKTRIIKELWNNRVAFVKHIGNTTPSDQQGDILTALDKYDNISVASGHGIGKTACLSWVVLHYMSCRPFCVIPCTAPTKNQMYDVLWSNLSKWHDKMSPLFSNQFQWQREKYFHKDYPARWFAVARTSTKEKPEALAGYHEDYVLRIIDEASGINQATFETRGGSYGRIETKELMCGNPTRLEGEFYDSHHRHKELYKTFQFSCLDSPIASKDFVERTIKKYGIESNYYRVRVQGLFPLRDGDSWIPYDLADECLTREIPDQSKFAKVFGIDVARYGDNETVIAIRQGNEFLPYHRLIKKSIPEQIRYIAQLANEEKPQQIFVDSCGIGGSVYDHLSEMGYPAHGIDVTRVPQSPTRKYYKVRDELWGNMRDWVESRRGKMWDDEDKTLLGQLTTPQYHIHPSTGAIEIDSKETMKNVRKLDSPDIADATMLTFAIPMADYSKHLDFRSFDDGEDFYANHGYKPFDEEAGY